MKKLLVIMMVVIGFSLTTLSCDGMNQEDVTITITDKERVYKNNQSQYLIFTESETFANRDFLFVGKFNSSDMYGRLREGKTYSVRVGGYRIPIFSSYRNILRINKEVE